MRNFVDWIGRMRGAPSHCSHRWDPGSQGSDDSIPYHVYVYNAGGAMQNANPDAGDPHSSYSEVES